MFNSLEIMNPLHILNLIKLSVFIFFALFAISYGENEFGSCGATPVFSYEIDIDKVTPDSLDSVIAYNKSLASTNSATPTTFFSNGLTSFTW